MKGEKDKIGDRRKGKEKRRTRSSLLISLTKKWRK